MAENPTVEELKAPLLAAVGAADLALATMTEMITNLRERAGETRGTATNRVEESRARLNKLQEELPEQFADLRERFTSDELRKAAEAYREAAATRYHDLVVRGEAALERLRSQSTLEQRAEDYVERAEGYVERAEGYVEQAVERTQEVLGNVASQTREVGERAAGLVGIELPKKDAEAQRAPAKKAPAKKAAAKKPSTGAAKATGATGTAKKATKATAAKKAPAKKKVTQK